MDDQDNGTGNELVFENDDALNWATMYEASGVGGPRIYIGLLGTIQRKERNQQVMVLLLVLPKHLKTQAVATSSKRNK